MKWSDLDKVDQLSIVLSYAIKYKLSEADVLDLIRLFVSVNPMFTLQSNDGKATCSLHEVNRQMILDFLKKYL